MNTCLSNNDDITNKPLLYILAIWAGDEWNDEEWTMPFGMIVDTFERKPAIPIKYAKYKDIDRWLRKKNSRARLLWYADADIKFKQKHGFDALIAFAAEKDMMDCAYHLPHLRVSFPKYIPESFFFDEFVKEFTDNRVETLASDSNELKLLKEYLESHLPTFQCFKSSWWAWRGRNAAWRQPRIGRS